MLVNRCISQKITHIYEKILFYTNEVKMKCAMLLGDKGRVLISLSNVIGPVGGYTISFVIHDQYDTRGRPIFPAAGQITILPVLNYTAW